MESIFKRNPINDWQPIRKRERLPQMQYVTHFDGVGVNGEVEPYTFVGDFKAVLDIHPTELKDYIPLLSWTGDDDVNEAWLNVNGGAGFRRSGLGTRPANGSFEAGERIQVELGRRGDVLYFQKDGVQLSSYGSAENLGDMTFDLLGGRGGNGHFKGGYLAAEWYDLSLPADDQLVRDYRFDRKDGVLRNYADSGELGSNLVDLDTMYVNEADNLVRDGAKVTWVNHTTWGQYQFRVPIVLKPGRSYLLKTHMTNAGRVGLSFPTAATKAPTGWIENNYYGYYKDVGNGEQITVVTIPDDADASNAKLAIAPTLTTYNDLDATVTQLELIEAEGWGLMHNLAADSVQRYQNRDSDLVDPLWPNMARHSGDLTKWGDGGGVSVDPAVERAGSPVPLSRLEVLADTGCQLFIGCQNLLVGTTYTLSLYIDKDSWGGNFQLAYYNGSSPIASETKTLSSGVHRYTLTFTVDSEATSPQVRLVGWNSSAPVGSVCYAGGVQLEVGTEATKYKPTGNEAAQAILASPLYKLRRRIERLLKNKAGSIRTIPRFDGVGMFGEIPEWTPSTNWEASISSASTVTTNQVLFGDNHTSTYYFNVGTTNHSLWASGNQHIANVGANEVADGQLHEARCVIQGNAADVYVDGVKRMSTGIAPYTGPLNFRIGDSLNAHDRWMGFISKFALIDLDDPLGNSRLYLMDSDTGILYDALAESGPELTTGHTLGLAGSVSLEGNIVTLTAPAWGYTFMDIDTVEGQQYELFADVMASQADGRWELRAWDKADSFAPLVVFEPDNNQTARKVFTAPSSSTRIGIHSKGTYEAGDTLTVRTLTLKTQPNAGQINNAPADAYPQFVYQGDQKKEWLSPEKAAYASTEQQTASSVSGEWEYYDLTPVVAGAHHRITANVHNTVPGKAAGFSSASGVPPSEPFRAYSDTEVGGDYPAANSGPVRLFRHAGSDVYLDNISVREFLKEAV